MCNIIYKSIARWFVCRRRHCETRGQEKPVHLLVYEPRGVRVYIYIYMMCVCVGTRVYMYMRLYYIMYNTTTSRNAFDPPTKSPTDWIVVGVYIIIKTHAYIMYIILYMYVYYMKI